MRSISASKLNTNTTTVHSTIPYLFGGLAAIMGLIAFALLMLACSYCGLSRNNQEESHSDLDNKESGPETKETVKDYEEKVLVIMAGDENPTFLANPAVFLNCDDNVLVLDSAASPQENQVSCNCS